MLSNSLDIRMLRFMGQKKIYIRLVVVNFDMMQLSLSWH